MDSDKNELEKIGTAPVDDEDEEHELGMVGLQGHIDAVEGGRVYGWAWNPEQPADRVEIEIRYKEDLVGTAVADRFRKDLVEIGMGDGIHAFVFDLPSDIRSVEPESVAAYFSQSQMPLSRGKPRMIARSDNANPNHQSTPLENLVGRIDRLEASLQQIFRAMNMYRRGEHDLEREGAPRDLDQLKGSIEDLSQKQDVLGTRLQRLESATNASKTFVDQFKIDIHDRITRGELEDLKIEHQRSIKFATFAAFIGVMISILLSSFVYYSTLNN